MAALFHRKWSVVVDSLKVEGLRIQFKVSKTLTKDPNTLDLKITNLSERTRAQMQSKGSRVILSAGYENDAGIIFAGDARTVDHVRDGAEWVTHIQCGDGERAYQFAHVAKAFRAGTPIATVIQSAAEALGINVGNLASALGEQFRGGLSQFPRGYTLHGKASLELDRLLKTVGLSWSVQDGALQVLKGGATLPGRVVLLSADTGMVGSPDHGTPDKKGGPSMLKVKTLLRPTIRCGGPVEIRAHGVKGQFRVEKLEHTGDTSTVEWYTSIEAKPQ